MGDAVTEGSAAAAEAAGTAATVVAVAAAAAGSSAPAAAATCFAGYLPPKKTFSLPVSAIRALFVRPPADRLEWCWMHRGAGCMDCGGGAMCVFTVHCSGFCVAVCASLSLLDKMGSKKRKWNLVGLTN